MIRLLVLALAAATLAGCGNSHFKPLPMVKDGDPVWQLNPDRWNASVNDLTTAPGDGTPQPLPAPVRIGSPSL